MPAVSVLMPCYNAAETLAEALDSLSLQTFNDFEVVAIDDGSDDATLKILQTRARQDGRMRVLRQSHRGIVSALNAGLEACRAPFIARMDADDRSHAERLALQVAFLEAHPEVAVVGCLVQGYPRDWVRQGFQIYLEWLNSLVSDTEIHREIFVESPLAHPTVIFRREGIISAGGYQEHGWPEDYDLWLRLYLSGAHFAKIPKVLLDWREHPARLTHSDRRYSLENFLRAKAFYLVQGPLVGRDAVIIWGAGMMGRRLSKHLIHNHAPIAAFVDIDPRKIGRTRRGLPVLAPLDLPKWWKCYRNPAGLVAVGARGVRPLIRAQLAAFGLREGENWWFAA